MRAKLNYLIPEIHFKLKNSNCLMLRVDTLISTLHTQVHIKEVCVKNKAMRVWIQRIWAAAQIRDATQLWLVSLKIVFICFKI